VALGADATPRDGLSLWWQRPVVLLSGLTVFTVLVLSVLSSRHAPEPVRPVPRPGSTEIVAFLPTGQVRRVSEFRWASPVDASRYIVVVRHAGSTAEVLRRETTAQVLTIDAELAPRFRPGDYNWTIEAVGSNGRAVAHSNVQTFLLR
jgi:hypothetical protein